MAVVGLALGACGGDDLTLPSEGVAAHLEITAGNDQTGRVSSPLPQPVVVKVTDTQGRPVQGAAVEFVLDGGASATLANPATDAAGEVSATITLGTQVGPVNGQARVTNETSVAATFTATAQSADAAGIAMVSGDAQSAQVGAPLAQPLVVKVTDGFGNPIPGRTVQWTVEGGGSVSEASTVTGEDGQTSVTRTLGNTAGEQRTLASSEGLIGSPVTFVHTATAGSASSVQIVSGNNQSAAAGSQLPAPLVVRVLDQDGNPIVNRAVSWVVGAGGGSVSPETSNTGADGQASTTWTLGSAPGTNTLSAVVSGVGTASFTATGTGSGSPSNLAIITQPPASTTVGATLSPAPVIQVRDAAGHDLAIAGVEIIVTKSSGAGQLEGTTTVATDANGRATFSDLRITGRTGSHRLLFSADGYRAVSSDKIEVQKASTTTTITGDSPDPSSPDPLDPNHPVTVTFSVTSGAGTPTGEVEVTADRAGGGSANCKAAVAAGSCILDLGSGDWTLTATYKGDDLFASSSSAPEPHHVNEPPPPPGNTPPTAQDDFFETPVGQALSVDPPGLLANDSDPDGDALTAQVESQPAQGGFAIVNPDGSFSYIPGTATGQDTFTYSVSDGTNSSTATVTITLQ